MADLITDGKYVFQFHRKTCLEGVQIEKREKRKKNTHWHTLIKLNDLKIFYICHLLSHFTDTSTFKSRRIQAAVKRTIEMVNI